MPYNPKTDSYQLISRNYKAALKRLAKMQHNTDRNTVEKLIDQACRAQGIVIQKIDSKG
jgi:hypothetical protein